MSTTRKMNLIEFVNYSANATTKDLHAVVEKRALRQIVVKIRVLRQVPDALMHAHVANVVTENLRGAIGGKDQTHQQLERCSFAGAVCAEKPEDLSAVD